jgi:hypothetical protein
MKKSELKLLIKECLVEEAKKGAKVSDTILDKVEKALTGLSSTQFKKLIIEEYDYAEGFVSAEFKTFNNSNLEATYEVTLDVRQGDGKSTSETETVEWVLSLSNGKIDLKTEGDV